VTNGDDAKAPAPGGHEAPVRAVLGPENAVGAPPGSPAGGAAVGPPAPTAENGVPVLLDPDTGPDSADRADAGIDREAGTADPEPTPAGPAASATEPAVPGSRLHPAWIVIGAVRRFRGFLVPLAVLLVTRDPREAGTLGLVLLATLAAVATQAVAWATTRWSVDGNRLRLTTGLLGRRERLVPLERVQSVDLSDTPLERLFGVAGVRVETAAGGQGIVLEAVGRPTAERLRARLLAARQPAGTIESGDVGAAPDEGQAASPTAAQNPPLYRMGAREVFLAGATSGRIGPALAVVGFGVGLIDDLAELPVADRFLAWMPLAAVRGIGAAAAVLAVGAVLAWLLAVAGAALTWSGFELRREGDRVLMTHGLLDRRRRSAPLSKIQAVTVRESLLRRPFGLAEVRFESAGRGADDADSGILLPLAPAAAIPGLMAAIAPALAPQAALPPLDAPPPRARARYLGDALRPLALLAALAVAAAAVAPGVAWWWGLLLLAGVPLAVAHGILGWRESGWALDGDRLLLRSGGLERRLTVAPRRRLQRRGTAQTPFARRAALATFRADLAAGSGGGRLLLRHLDAGEAARLVERLRGR
jgi:putative membrane protein